VAIGGDAISAWIERVGVRGLLPPHLAETGVPGGTPALRGTVGLPVAGALALASVGDASVVVPVIDEGGVRRAVPGDGVFEAIADLVSIGADVGPLHATRLQDLPAASGERAIDVDQSNESVVVGDRLVVKLFPRVGVGPQPGEDLPAHLAAVGSGEIPTPYGSLRWTLPDGSSVLVSTVTAFLPGARDGWDWYLDHALRAIGGQADPAASIGAAQACGALVGRLHAALATPSDVFGPAPVGAADGPTVRSWTATGRSLLADAVAATGGAEGERLAGMAPEIAGAFDGFGDAIGTPIQRIHGDLHVGQILAGPHGYAVTDLDGNPLAPPAERTARAPAARDVAAFVRSLDHVGRLAQRRLSERDRETEAWIADVRAAFLDSYRSTLTAARAAHLFDERLLWPFEVLQECHEYVYAARFLPRWLPVPDLAMPRLLRGAPA
jgi:maltokinase